MKHKLSFFFLLFSFHYCLGQSIDTAAARLNNYRDKIFTVFNTCNSHDEKIINEIRNKDANNIETARIVLLECAKEGTKQLAAIEDFDGDPSLKYACRDVLKFYIQLAESDIPQVRDFFVLEENFLKIQKEFKKKKAKKYSQEEISTYNSEVKKYNEALKRHTQLGNFITGSRKMTLYNWNATQKIFMDTHTAK